MTAEACPLETPQALPPHPGDVPPADSKLLVPVTRRQKARYVKQANRQGMKLSDWVTQTLNAACPFD